MRISVVAGGWHWPAHFYEQISRQSIKADLFVVGHRNPELSIVRKEKLVELSAAPGRLGELDRELYKSYPTVDYLRAIGWDYREEPNICGDWCFFNQWLARHDYRDYDVILNCHDDTYIRRLDLFEQLDGDWLILANGGQPCEPPGYCRGSFEFWSREMLDMLGGRIDMGPLKATREGRTDSPASRDELQPWNDHSLPVRKFMVERGIADRLKSLSPCYRVSKWAIEGERGFLSRQAGGDWSMKRGLEMFPI